MGISSKKFIVILLGVSTLATMTFVTCALSLNGTVADPFSRGDLRSTLGSVRDPSSDLGMISKFLKELMEGELFSCHPILLTQKVVRSYKLLSILQGLQSALTPLLVYDIELFLRSEPPSVPVLRFPASEKSSVYCVAYYLLAPLRHIESALAIIPKSDWFSGSARYFVAYTGDSLTISELERNPALLAAYNTLYITVSNSRNNSKGDRHWPIHLLSNCPFCRSGEPEVILRNSWSAIHGLMRKDDLFPDLFQDCNGHVFRGVTMSFPPFIYYTEGSATQPIVLLDSVDARIITTISRVYNFTFVKGISYRNH